MLSAKVIETLEAAGLCDAQTLRFTHSFHLFTLPGIGPATINKIRKHFGPSVFDVSPRVAAEFMNLPYEEIGAIRTNAGWSLDGSTFCNKPELIAKAYYTSQGHSCEYGENQTITILMTALANRLVPPDGEIVNPFTGETYHGSGGLFRQVRLNALIRDDPAKVAQAISDATERDLQEGLSTMIRYDKIPDSHFVEIWKLLGPETISRLAKHHVNRTAYKGWPDLTLIRDETVWFMEVKTTDHFHESQVDLWLDVGKPLGLMFGIVTVKRR